MSRTAKTVPPTDQPTTISVTLPNNRRWDRTNRPDGEFSRTQAALWSLVYGASCEPALLDDELKAAAAPAFDHLERQRNGASPDEYLTRYPRRRERYKQIAQLLEVSA